MTPLEELASIDAEWDTDPPDSGGAFGHSSERRIGLRVRAGCWALISDGSHSAYARAVELSATGCVLELFDGNELPLDGHTFEIDLFVPSIRPVHATARPVRAIGKFEAFELSAMNAVDRLTLAEHLDDLVAKRAIQKPPPSEARASSPPVSWKNFVLSLKRRDRASASVAAEHS